MPKSETDYMAWENRVDVLLAIRPDLKDKPQHERIGCLFVVDARVQDLAEALAVLCPESREFWLRVQAQSEFQFRHGVAALFKEHNASDHAPD